VKILLFDNYDSFTFNLVHLVKELGYSDIEVHRNDKISLDDVRKFDRIILSPGPGIPAEAGILLPLIKCFAHVKPILGVCLGHQAIAESFGGKLVNLANVYHGVSTSIHIVVNEGIFVNLPNEILAGRYHSWIVDENNFPRELRILAKDDNGYIMALRHNIWNVYGVQFHPESILTPNGKEIIAQFLSMK
jgi:anthranilate synthase component 2